MAQKPTQGASNFPLSYNYKRHARAHARGRSLAVACAVRLARRQAPGPDAEFELNRPPNRSKLGEANPNRIKFLGAGTEPTQPNINPVSVGFHGTNEREGWRSRAGGASPLWQAGTAVEAEIRACLPWE